MTRSAPLAVPTWRAVLLVARREFVTQVRSRTFLVGLLVTIVLFAVIGGIATFVATKASSHTLGLTPTAATLAQPLQAAAAADGSTLTLRPVDEPVGRAQVRSGDLDALLLGGPGDYRLVGRDSVPGELQTLVSTAARTQALDAALASSGVTLAQIDARTTVGVTTLEPAAADRGQQLGIALVGTFLLFFSFSAYGQLVATGVVEEKQSRVVELLLSTIKPWQLLTGKIAGLGAVGLLQLVILSALGLGAGAVTGTLTVPGAAAGMVLVVVVWYLLGFTLFAALYAAVGSTVSRQEELNSVIAPMIFVVIIPFILTVNLLPNDPHNGLAAVLSYVPFFAQTVMPARYALGVASGWEVALSALITLAAIVVVVRVASRVYRNSILRTGGRIRLRDALRG